MKTPYRFSKEHVLLVIILLLAAVLRFLNLSWDGGLNIHPDEALIVNGALAIRFFSNLNPGFHDYNGLPVYILRAVGPHVTSAAEITYLGRIITAALSTHTVLNVFLLGKRLWGVPVGLLAAALLAPLPIAVQQAHFYTSDTFVVLFLSLLSLAVVEWWQTPSRKNIFFCAVWAGLAIACKNTAYLLLLMPAMAVVSRKGLVHEKVKNLAFLVAAAAGVFAITSPYSFLDLSGYLARSKYLADVVAGKLQFDWTVQFINTTPLFWVRNSLYAFGPAVVALGFFGVVTSVFQERGVKRIFALWAVVFLALLAGVYLKFIRYLLPLAPLFVLFAAAFMGDLHKRAPRVGKIIGGTVVALTWIWGIMFVSIYVTPHPLVEAASWLAVNAPNGATIVREEGNELLRFAHTPLNVKTYSLFLIHPYALPDTKAKVEAMRTQISQANFVLIESDKARNTVMRLRELYPYTSRVYEELEEGSLEYTLVAEFASFPHLGPFVFNDLGAEETFWVFDHPQVKIYERIALD